VPARAPDGYDPSAYPPFAVTVDVVVFSVVDRRVHVVLIERKRDPHAGTWALPGGFVDIDEDLHDAAVRELREETGVDADAAVALDQLRAYGAPGRDPRMRVVSIAYLALLRDPPALTAGDDAARAELVAVDDVLRDGGRRLAFDHRQILEDALAVARRRLQSPEAAAALARPGLTADDVRAAFDDTVPGA
jgi:8-oxo-dGTP diphosphatase